MSVLQGYNGEIFSVARLPSDSPNFKNFFGRVAVLKGLCNLNNIEGIFYESRNRQYGQTFFIFLEGVSFSGVFVTYIRWRVFFHDPRHRQNCQTLPFFLGWCFVFVGLSYWYIMGGFFLWSTPRQV